MFGLRSRTALVQPKYLPIPPRTITQLPIPTTRAFNSTPRKAAFRPTWMPMRVKTPWIDALTQSREARHEADSKPASPSVEPDLIPKKMSDSHYSAVRPTQISIQKNQKPGTS